MSQFETLNVEINGRIVWVVHRTGVSQWISLIKWGQMRPRWRVLPKALGRADLYGKRAEVPR
jgi:hypothetical protein